MSGSTISNDKTIAGGGEGAILAGRYRIIRQKKDVFTLKSVRRNNHLNEIGENENKYWNW